MFTKWSYFGFDTVITGVDKLRDKVENKVLDMVQNSALSPDGPAPVEFASCSFGGGRWIEYQ